MPLMRRRVIRTLAFGALACGLGVSRAEAAQCTLTSTSVAFGGYNVFFPVPTDTIGTITYRCNGGAKNVVLTISAGQAGTDSPRVLGGPSNERLVYNLYRDAGRSAVWGSNVSQGAAVADPPNNTDETLTIFGRIPGGQDVRAGTYSDNVSVTLNF
jgi:spore coat protein U-like protein